MPPGIHDLQRLSRRSVLRQMGMAPLLLRPSPFLGLSLMPSFTNRPDAPNASYVDQRFRPHYPVRSPLDDVLRLVAPGSDEYVTEKYAFAIARVLERWGESFKGGNPLDGKRWFAATMQASSLHPIKQTRLREGSVACTRREYATSLTHGPDDFVRELGEWVGSDGRFETTAFEITALEERGDHPLTVEANVRYSIVIGGAEQRREQRTGSWLIEWVFDGSSNEKEPWRVRRWQAGTEVRAVTHGQSFLDVTEEALGTTASYEAQMLRGADHWRTVLDGACGIDVYGNNGVTAGDFDGDGFDDLYVCQPAGLPNRLFRNRGDGTFEDMTERAGVGVLDNTACALFADFRNSGLQDLLVVCGSGPLLFLNQGDGTFVRKRDAFRFDAPAQGTFTHAAIADYDRDGRLDIYFCLYSYYLGLDQYHYPAPYFDARNGPPNFLFHNEGDGTFVDRTEIAGLNADNDRYSFACAWNESTTNSMPDLYVVNDFGRNNLYRSKGDGTFHSAAREAHVEDVGAGMSACWMDYNQDEKSDLYVANMWSAAGQRVAQQKRFHESASEGVRELYRRHARGNALYRNQGDGTFANVSEQAGVEMGGWAWCSDAWDFDHDGYADLYVTNGYISALEPEPANVRGQEAADDDSPEQQADLGSFFWRQVVGKSPEDKTPSLAYERGWNALNELIRSDHSWSGHERNVMLANNHDGTFAEVSGAVELDFLEDGRSFALADLNHDGRQEIILKNRNAPQLRIVRNVMKDIGDSIVFRLRGTKSNRDAIGTAITLVVGQLQQTKHLQSGTGFLAQHSKEIFFGVGRASDRIRATVRWPSGLIQEFTDLPRNHRILIAEGEKSFTATAFIAVAPPSSTAPKDRDVSKPLLHPIETWLISPLRAPSFSLPDLSGDLKTLASFRGRFVLLHFWSVASPLSSAQLRSLDLHSTRLSAEGLRLVAIHLKQTGNDDEIRNFVRQQRLSYPVLFATEEVAGIYNIIYRYLFDRRRNLALPTSFLLDHEGMIVKVYQGSIAVDRWVQDVKETPHTPLERIRKALPFAGTLYEGQFLRNDFTYGIAMFQHGYLAEAEDSFRQVIAERPNDAEGYYNLGTLNLRSNNFVEARKFLTKTLALKADYPEAWNNLGMMAAQEGHADDAVQAFRESLRLRPSYTIALLNLGNVYRRQHAYNQAYECLTQALALQPDDPETNYSLGMLYAQQNQLEPARRYLEHAVSLRPAYPEALNNLGVLDIRKQDYGDAERRFRTCVDLVPDFEDSYLNLARLYILQHETGKAVTSLQELLRRKPDSIPAKQGLETLSAQQ